MTENHAHYPALDGVRGLAVLIVIGAHTTPQVFAGGNIGVDLFFVLSGYLITTILLNEHDATGTISIKNFYLRRVCRLLPALVLLLLVSTIYACFAGPTPAVDVAKNSAVIITYWWNWFLSWGYQPETHSLIHLWSLSVEEQFYIAWPFILLLALPRPKIFLTVLAVGLIGPNIGRLSLWESGPSLPLYFRTDLRFDSIIWGAATATILRRRFNIPNLNMIGALALIAFLILACFNLLSNGFLYQGGYVLIGLICATIITYAVLAQGGIAKGSLDLPFLRWTGKISYGLYLWHVPIFYAMRPFELTHLVG